MCKSQPIHSQNNNKKRIKKRRDSNHWEGMLVAKLQSLKSKKCTKSNKYCRDPHRHNIVKALHIIW